MRYSINVVAISLLAGCVANAPRQNHNPARFVLSVAQRSGNTAVSHACPAELLGVIQGRVDASELSGDIHVLYRMSGDATIDVLAAPDGSFEIACVYPAASYNLCVESSGQRACANVEGPDARNIELRVLHTAPN